MALVNKYIPDHDTQVDEILDEIRDARGVDGELDDISRSDVEAVVDPETPTSVNLTHLVEEHDLDPHTLE